MKIAYVSGNTWPGREPGLSFSLHFARGFLATDAEATLYLFARTDDAEQAIRRDFYGDGEVPRIRALRAPLRRSSRSLYHARVFAELCRERYDVVLFRSLTFLPWAARLRRLKGVPTWFEAHDFWTDPSVRDAPVKRSRRRHVRLEQRWVREMDGVLCVSEPQAELYRRYYPELPVVAAETACQPPRAEPRGSWTHTLGYVGSVNEEKYPLGVVMRALADQGDPRVRLLVVGATDDQRIALEARARELGVGERVEVHGWKVGAELRALEERMDVGVACLADDFLNRIASPLKVLEYLSGGLPFVATRLPGIERLVEDGREGLLVDNTPAAWARALSTIYSDEDRWRAMSRRALEASASMSWERRAARVVAALEAWREGSDEAAIREAANAALLRC